MSKEFIIDKKKKLNSMIRLLMYGCMWVVCVSWNSSLPNLEPLEFAIIIKLSGTHAVNFLDVSFQVYEHPKLKIKYFLYSNFVILSLSYFFYIRD